MAKQTNAFQQLIHYIYEKLEGQGATVTESALLLEQNVDEEILREVDVLIEKTIDDETVRIAVECRDRNSKDDIQWVDCLIGKYMNLVVHKVIAVSNSGYSKSAQLKAVANRIELMTLEEVINIDFDREFVKLGMASVCLEFKLKQVVFECLPQLKPTPKLKVFHCDDQIGSVDELLSSIFKELTEKKLASHINQNFLDIFKTREGFNMSVLVEHKIPINNLAIQSNCGTFHKLLSLTLIIMAKPDMEEVEVRHRLFKKALVTNGSFEFDNQDKVHTIFAAQMPQSTEGRFFVKSTKKKRIG